MTTEKLCKHLEIVDILNMEEKRRIKEAKKLDPVGGTGLIEDRFPKGYCKLTGNLCVAEETSFFDLIFRKTIDYQGASLHKKRLKRCPFREYHNPGEYGK